ncbi:complement binding [Raccoonpox virus]|uniref:Complement control protein C3 n=1 Tax=Raccoon poxvirus TaxID=10256 RepID=A0A0G3FXH8_RACVI|nr:Secreted complement binding protein C3b/C4b [Raccoonpox virus]AKJ93655.1 Secreted complement binding protein C3b/C4b [Raccoonpox virus]AOP31286.1 complement binding [Raccoonpox virus]
MNAESVAFITLLGIGCVLSSCNVPTRPINMKFKNGVNSHYNIGDRVEYTCLPGYRKGKVGPIYVKCTTNGWSSLFNQCIKRKCPSPRDIENGRLEVTGTDFGSSITYSCDSGYKMIGEPISYCELGYTGSMVWNPEPPICESVKCVSPPSIDHGSNNGYSDIYTDGTVVTYTCDSGYSLIGNENILCSGGEWSDVPTCKIVKCPHPIIPHGFMSGGFKRSYSYNDKVYFTCNNKYKLIGPSYSTCSSENEWKPELPKCEQM